MNVYDELGVQPFINAYRPLTRLGGATMPEPVIEAMRQASRKNIDLRDMQHKVGTAIARLTQNDAAYVSCGANSGITLAIAACIAGTDPILSERLPHTEGMRNEIIMYECERGYKSDVAIRCAGATIINIGSESGATERELLNAVTPKTAAIFAHDKPHPGKLLLNQLVSIAKDCHIPVLIDAAFSIPPRRKLWEFTRDAGVDAVFISGGKGLRGPQCTGLVLGRAWIVNACTFHGAPNDRIGRGMKVGKEELAGVYAAVKLFMDNDEEFETTRREQQLDYIISCVRHLPGIRYRKLSAIKAMIEFEPRVFGFDYQTAAHRLLGYAPSVYVQADHDGLLVSTECLEDAEEKVVGNQLRRLFTEQQKLNR